LYACKNDAVRGGRVRRVEWEEGVGMITCPRCGSGTAVQIVRDAAEPGPNGEGSRWVARCEDCGSTWSMVDGA
jgi:transposase-like protein